MKPLNLAPAPLTKKPAPLHGNKRFLQNATSLYLQKLQGPVVDAVRGEEVDVSKVGEAGPRLPQLQQQARFRHH